MKALITLTLLALAAIPLGAWAGTTPESALLNALQPGEWHMKTLMSMQASDKKTSVSPMTVTMEKCFKKSDLHKLLMRFNLNLPKSASCKQLSRHSSGGSSSVTERCTARKKKQWITCNRQRKFSGISYTVNMECDSVKGQETARNVMQMHGSYTVESGSALRGHLDVRGQGQGKAVHMTMRRWARRVGGCPAHSGK